MNLISRISARPQLGETIPAPQPAATKTAAVDQLTIGSRPSWVQNVARTASAEQPDPARHDHALYAVTVTGFSAKEVGEVFGKGELFISVADYPRMQWVKAGRNEWIDVKNPQPFTLSHRELDLAAGTVTLRFDLYDYDSLKKNDHLGAFEAKVKLADLARGDLVLDLQSTNGNAKAKATVRRRTLDAAQVPPAFVAKRGGDWARVAADYSTQVELQFRADYAFKTIMPEASGYFVNAPSGWNTVAALQEDALFVRDAIVALDVDLPRRKELVDAYNKQVRDLAKNCVVVEQWYDSEGRPSYVLYYAPFDPPKRFFINEAASAGDSA